MSRIFKANSVQIDENNRVLIETNNYDFLENGSIEYTQKVEKVEKDNIKPEEYIQNLLKNAEVKRINIMQNAEMEANQIIENATAEAEKIYSERFNSGYEDGFNSGKEEVFNKAIAEVNEMKEEAQKIIDKAKSDRDAMINELEPEIVDLIYNLVEDLIKTEMKYDASLILSLVKEGINNTTILEKITIKLSDVDYDLVVERREELEKLIDSTKELKIIKDFTLQNNDCIIETDFGYVNCSIDEKLKTLKKNLELILKSR